MHSGQSSIKGNMGTANNGIAEQPDLESLSTNDDGPKDVGLEDLDDLGNNGEGPSASFYSPSSPANQGKNRMGKKKKKKSCCPNCLNKSLVGLKALLFIFYGGVGVVVTWLNHLELSKRFTEKECLLVYGLSALLSAVTPFVFGLISDRSGQPRRVLAASMLLAGLLYPLILLVSPAVPPGYKPRYDRCIGPGRSSDIWNGSYCLPVRFNCYTDFSEIVSDAGGCGRGCGGKLSLSNCNFIYMNGTKMPKEPFVPEDVDYSYDGAAESVPVPSGGTDELTGLAAEGEADPFLPPWKPHICRAPRTHELDSKHSNQSLCHVYTDDRKSIKFEVKGVSGREDQDGKCHYPLIQWSEELKRAEHLFNCSPVAENVQVYCDLKWDGNAEDQWSCNSDFIQWAIAFGSFVALHTIGTMFLIAAAGLLNVAILSMTHEHQGYFGCQLTYAALGFGVLAPSTAYLFEYLKEFEIPWSLDYVAAYSVWLILSALLVLTLPHHAEWVPKPGTIGPMLRRWASRGHTVLFFLILVILGGLEGLVDTLGFFQARSLGATLLHLGFGGLAAMIPALIFIYRVEKVIEFCGYHNVLAIALVVVSLQFTGYAYLKNVVPEWMFLLKSLDTFSAVMVWAAAAHTTYNAAPRSLVATCQAIIVTLYCCLGRGLGCCWGYIVLLFFSREVVLKGLSIASVVVCVVYLVSHYCVLKPNPYSRHYDTDHGFAPRGKYTPLKLLPGAKGKPDERSPTKASTEEAS